MAASPDTLGLLLEATQLARDLGYRVREESLGDLPGGGCTIAGTPHVILNIDRSAAERLGDLVAVLAADPRVATAPKSRLLEDRLREPGQSAR